MIKRRTYNKLDRDPFYHSQAWRQLRARYVEMYGNACHGSDHDERKPRSGPTVKLELDHVIERWDAPELALDIGNLVMLCRGCHKRKTDDVARRRSENEYWARKLKMTPQETTASFIKLEREHNERERQRLLKRRQNL